MIMPGSVNSSGKTMQAITDPVQIGYQDVAKNLTGPVLKHHTHPPIVHASLRSLEEAKKNQSTP